MKNTHIRRLIYHIRHRYFTFNNAVVFVALLIAAGFVWGSLNVMQRNYTLQRNLDHKQQELALAKLETRNLELQGVYYQTREYQELAVRERLGLGFEGEHALIMPKSTPSQDDTEQPRTRSASAPPSNFEQWMDFLFGTNRSRLQ